MSHNLAEKHSYRSLALGPAVFIIKEKHIDMARNVVWEKEENPCLAWSNSDRLEQ